MTILALEGNAGNVEIAVADITNGYGSGRHSSTLHPTERCRAGDDDLAGRNIAGDVNDPRSAWVIAVHGDLRWLRTKTDRLETNGHWDRVAGFNRQWIRQNVRRQELSRRGSDAV